MSLRALLFVAWALSQVLLMALATVAEGSNSILTFYAAQYFLDDDDVLLDIGELFFTSLFCLLLTEGRSFQQNSGDLALPLPCVAR